MCVCVCVCVCAHEGREGANGESTAECKQFDWSIRFIVTVDCRSLADSSLLCTHQVEEAGDAERGCRGGGGGNRQVRTCWFCFSLLAARLAVDVMIAKFCQSILVFTS